MSPDNPDNDDPTGLAHRADSIIAQWAAEDAAAVSASAGPYNGDGIVDTNAGETAAGEGEAPQNPATIHEIQHSSGLETPQEQGIKIAQNALATIQPCKDLFKGGDGLTKFNELVKGNRIVTRDFVNSDGWRLTEHPDAFGIYSPKDDKIYVNPRGALANGDYSDPIFHGMTRAEAWALFYIHETAHKTGRFGPDNYGSESLRHSMEVRGRCFPKTVH